MIRGILLVDDEDLFREIFEDVCKMLNITLYFVSVSGSEDAETKLKKWTTILKKEKPECFFIDMNLIGSEIDGVELIERINTVYGNGVIIGIISSSNNAEEINKAIKVGARFWIKKTDDIENRLVEFYNDYEKFKTKEIEFKKYL